MADPRALLGPIRDLHDRIRDGVVEACAAQSSAELATVAADGPGDTIYKIDRVSERLLIEGFTELARTEPLCLIAEGLADGKLILPSGTHEAECRWRILMDPIDGTRGLMFQKRSAWILTGVAPNLGGKTRLSDISLAVQTEIPLLKQHLSDQVWAVRGEGVLAERYDRVSGLATSLSLRPSGASDLAHGFSTVVRFFAGHRGLLTEVDDELFGALGTGDRAGKAFSFEDQYASTGGQLYELMAGHDRFIADLRPLVSGAGLCCHPYDICTALIAGELGVVLTDALGKPVDGPMDLQANIAWVGYANAGLRALVEPVLMRTLRRRGLVP